MSVHFDRALVSVAGDGRHLRVQLKSEALPFKQLLCFASDLSIRAGENSGQIFEYTDRRSQAAPHGAQFQTDDSGTNHNQLFRNLGPGERFGAGSDAVAVRFHARE